jgi:hypothetical protein
MTRRDVRYWHLADIGFRGLLACCNSVENRLAVIRRRGQ